MTRFERFRARGLKRGLQGRQTESGVAQIRLAKATALVLVIVCSAPCIDAVMPFFTGSNISQDKAHALHIGSALAGTDVFSALDNVEAALASSEQELPADLAEELVVLPGAYSVRFDESSQVAGYSIAKGEAEAFEELEAGMELRGWQAVPLGGINGATFTKQGGGCGWVLATCTQVGEATSVVLRCITQ